LSALGLVATIVLGTLSKLNVLDASVLGLAVAAGVDILLLLTLAFAVRPEWVRESAEAYAERLLGSLETLLTVGS